MEKHQSKLIFKIIIYILAVVFTAGILLIQPITDASINKDYTMQNATCVYNPSTNKQTLNGKWEFYYKQLLVSDNIVMTSQKKEYLDVPQKWNVASNGKYPIGGYGSYRGYITGVPVGEKISIGFDNLSVAYSIYINGEKIGGSGEYVKNGTSYTATSIPGDQINYSNYVVKTTEPLEVVIEVVTNSSGGLYKCPILFTNNSISRFIYNKLIQKCIVIGIFFIAIMMHIFRLVTSKKGKRNIVPLILTTLLLAYSVLSGCFYAYFATSNSIVSAETIDAISAAIDMLISATLCVLLFNKAHKKRSIVGCALTFGVYLIVVILQALEGVKFFINPVTYYVVLGSRPIIAVFVILFLFPDKGDKNIAFYNKVSYGALCMTEFVKTLNNSGLFYDSTRDIESILVLIAIIFNLIAYFESVKMTNKIVWENEQLTEDNTQFKINLLLNQIKPHFLYNTLNSINSLCKINPNEASNAIVSFSNYLRNNMDSISDSNMITLSKELEHVKCYVDIEQIRFRERLKVKYDIKTYDFMVPPLSIQAISENAIKHGMSSMVDGVTLTIKTYEDKNFNYINISDNGVGFDINSISESDSVGLSNICRRIEMLCKGELIIKSRIGKGTSITLKLKK